MDLGKVLGYILGFKNEEGLHMGLNSFQLILKMGDGTIGKQVYKGKACYAPLRRGEFEIGVEPLLLQVTLTNNRNKVEEDLKDLFIDYLVNRSPLSGAFISKDVAFIKENGALLSTEVPSNYMIFAATVFRSLWEYVYIPQMWKELVDSGVPEDLALVAAHRVEKEGDRYKYVKPSGHRAFPVDTMSEEDVLNFINGVFINPSDSYKKSKSYGGINALYCGYVGASFFQKYNPKVIKKKSDPWSTWTEEYDTSIEHFASFLKKEYKRMTTKKEPEKKKKDERSLEDKHFDYLMSLIKVKNGLSLKEVRMYRKALRQIKAIGEEAGWGVRLAKNSSFDFDILWMDAEKYTGVTFSTLHYFCEDNGIYEENPYHG